MPVKRYTYGIDNGAFFCEERPDGAVVNWSDYDKLAARVDLLERALYGSAESLASFRHKPSWTELDEVTLFDAQTLCRRYP